MISKKDFLKTPLWGENVSQGPDFFGNMMFLLGFCIKKKHFGLGIYVETKSRETREHASFGIFTNQSTNTLYHKMSCMWHLICILSGSMSWAKELSLFYLICLFQKKLRFQLGK